MLLGGEDVIRPPKTAIALTGNSGGLNLRKGKAGAILRDEGK
jgi:hypothetical protein